MSIVGTVWHPRGPSPLLDKNQRDNGRTNAIAVHPQNDQIAYIGAAGGGVWQTADGGATWRPLFDRQPSLGIAQISLAIGEPAAVAIDPADPDVIYAGTGPRKIVSGSAAAVGLFKSTDGGASWVLLGSGYPADNTGNAATVFGTTAATINSIIVDPANPSVVYLAASTGVWRSANGGLDWALGTGSNIADVRSLVLDRSSRRRARILYAGISGQGVFQSADGGQNWTSILSTSTKAVADAIKKLPGARIGQVVLDLAPPASPPAAGGIQVIYAAIAVTTSTVDTMWLFVSTDQGRTWSQQAVSGMTPGQLKTQTGFCMTLAVDPASPGDGANDVLFLGCTGQGRSTDSGQNFTPLAGLHADTHGWGFFTPPAPAPTIVYCVTDGGVFRSGDGGVSWKSRNEGGLQTALVYNLDIRPDAIASESAASFQDNGSKLAGSDATWQKGNGGDGFDIVYSGTKPDRLMLSQNHPNNKGEPKSQVLRSPDDGQTWTDVTPFPGGTATDAGLFKPQLAADPSSTDVFYATSTTTLYQTRDFGKSWRPLTAVKDLRNFSFGAAVAVAPTDPNSVVVASSTVLVSTNALGSTPAFTDITRNLPGRVVLRVAFDPNDATVIYAVLGGFAGAGPPGHVFRTTLTSAAWTDISPDLDAPFGALALDGQDTPTTIYVGTDIGGVLRSVDLGATWTVLDDLHFPRAPVTDLVIGRGSQVLQAATFGRGVFTFISPDWGSIAVNPEAGFDFGTTCGDEIAYRTLEVFNVGTSALVITSVQRLMGSAGFEVAQSPGTPLEIEPGEHVDFTVGFSATTPGTAEKATIRIVSDDRDAPTVDLIAIGLGGTPALAVSIAGTGAFPDTCLHDVSDQTLTLNNSGACPLTITAITSSSADFLVPETLDFPLVIAPGGDLDLPLRFQPAHIGDSAGTITIVSNDPASPAAVAVSGHTPGGRLTITGTADFGPVLLGDHARQTLSICNTGDCDLHVTRVAFRPPGPCEAARRSPCGCAECTCRDAHPAAPSRECDQKCLNFRILTNPFPATVHPGSCLGVLLEYVPTCDSAACCELVIDSDDPDLPQRTVLVTGRLRRTLRSALKCWAAQELHEILEAGNC